MSPKLIAVVFSMAVVLAGCTVLPGQGPSSYALTQDAPLSTGFELVDVNPHVLQTLRSTPMPALGFGSASSRTVPSIATGDFVRISIWETGSVGLFSASGNPNVPSAGSQATEIPEQQVGSDGAISVPYVGRVSVGGMTQAAAEQRIQAALEGVASQPQVLVTVTRQLGSTVSVLGEINSSGRIPLSQAGDRIIDILATAGGIRIPVDAAMINLSRGGYTAAVPMRTLVTDSNENVYVNPGDVITVTAEPEVFFATGATGRNAEIEFGSDTLTVQQAIARSGGLIDSRSDPSGVFVLRLEHADVVRGFAPDSPLLRSGGLVPVVYRFDMRDPYSVFMASTMEMQHRDTLYVTNSALSDFSKFTRLFATAAAPVATSTGIATRF